MTFFRRRSYSPMENGGLYTWKGHSACSRLDQSWTRRRILKNWPRQKSLDDFRFNDGWIMLFWKKNVDVRAVNVKAGIAWLDNNQNFPTKIPHFWKSPYCKWTTGHVNQNSNRSIVSLYRRQKSVVGYWYHYVFEYHDNPVFVFVTI